MSQEREVFLAPNWALEPIGVSASLQCHPDI